MAYAMIVTPEEVRLNAFPRLSFFLIVMPINRPLRSWLVDSRRKASCRLGLDKWHLILGNPWQPDIEKALEESETCAVFVGPSWFGPWQNEEMRAAIDRRVRDSGSRFRVIPVFLPGAKRAERSSLPIFLVATTWVEFPDSLDDPAAFPLTGHFPRPHRRGL